MTFVQQLLQCIAQKDPIKFTKIIKTIGYKNIYNRDFSRAFYPVLRKFMEYDWDVGTGHASRISELIWSMGRLGFKATVPEQAGLAMSCYIDLLIIRAYPVVKSPQLLEDLLV